MGSLSSGCAGIAWQSCIHGRDTETEGLSGRAQPPPKTPHRRRLGVGAGGEGWGSLHLRGMNTLQCVEDPRRSVLIVFSQRDLHGELPRLSRCVDTESLELGETFQGSCDPPEGLPREESCDLAAPDCQLEMSFDVSRFCHFPSEGFPSSSHGDSTCDPEWNQWVPCDRSTNQTLVIPSVDHLF